MGFRASHIIPAAIEDVWQWHTRSGAISRLTPNFLPMHPIKQATSLANGTTIFGLPAGLTWEARHDLSGYVNGRMFTDVCITSPIRALANWRHVHSFQPSTLNGKEVTIIHDEVHTRIPANSLRSMFAYRQHQLLEDVQRQQEFDSQPLTVAITGSRGLVGRALTAQLTTLGHEVIQLVRSKAKPGQRLWNPEQPHPELLEGVDVLVHLAGEPIFGRFNEAHKSAIYDSRVAPTAQLATLASNSGIQAFISASAIGFYGHDRGDELLDESSTQGDGFLAEVVHDWESAARQATCRNVQIRTGVVLSGRGGMLPVYRGLSNVGLGGTFMGKSPWLSWISIDDLCDIYVHAITQEVSGVINAVAPNPVDNHTFAKAIGTEMKRPSFIPIPNIAPKLILGAQGADELAFANQRVQSTRLADFRFRYAELASALAHELGGEELLEDPTR